MKSESLILCYILVLSQGLLMSSCNRNNSDVRKEITGLDEAKFDLIDNRLPPALHNQKPDIIWKEYNDYNGEATGYCWKLFKDDKSMQLCCDDEVFEEVEFIEMKWSDFKNLYPDADANIQSNVIYPIHINNSEKVLLAGPLPDETETWSYPVYLLVLHTRTKPIAFKNHPLGKAKYLSYYLFKQI